MSGTDATHSDGTDVTRRRVLRRSAVAAGAVFTGAAAVALEGLRDAPPVVAQAVAALVVERGDTAVSSDATTLDFAAADFDLSESPAGEVNISVGMGVTRDAQIGVLSVKEYGAVGDGVADDTSALAVAAYVAALSGRTVVIPAGNYKVSGSGLQIGSGLRVVGMRGARVFLGANAAVDARVISILDGAKNVSIEGLEIDGNRANQTQVSNLGIRIGLASRIRIHNCDIHDCTSHGISDLGSAYCEISSNWIHDCDGGGVIARSVNGNRFFWVHHNLIENVGNSPNQITWHGIDCRSTDAVVDHNIVHNVGHDAISGYVPANLRITISHNICWNDPNWRPIDDGGGHGVHTGGNDIKVIGNTIYNWTGAAIFVRNDPNGSPPAGAYIEVIGNTVHGVDSNRWGMHNPPFSGQGIRVENFVHGVIANNRVTSTNQEGLMLRANTAGTRPAGNMAITGNEIEDTDLHGISIEGASGVTLTGNSVQHAGGSPAASVSHGIRLLGLVTGAERVAIVGNTVHQSTGDGINASDTGPACQNVTVTGNVVTANGGFGIRTQNKSNRFCVTGNVLQGNAGGTVSLAGTQNVNANNLL